MRKSLFFATLSLIITFSTFAQTGANDPTFNPNDQGFGFGDGPHNDVSTMAIQSDGKIIIGGKFTSYNGTEVKRIARLNLDGSLDSSFNPGTGANDEVLTIAIQSDGKIIIGGDFTSYNGTATNHIIRINANGTQDASFNVGTGANSSVFTTAIQSDGKVIIGGSFESYNGSIVNHITRLNSDGSLDVGFYSGTGANNNVSSIAIQSDGKIIIGGGFSNYNGAAINYIARLNTDGSLDSFFTTGTGANSSVSTIAIQSDGKIIIGGGFTSYNGTNRNYIARLNAGGSLDALFNPGTGANFYVLTTAIQSDGKIIVGGMFTSYNGTAINRITRLNGNGSLDGSFNIGTGANGYVSATAIQNNGKIIIGGGFPNFNGTGNNFIIRLNNNGSHDTTFNLGTGANNYVFSTAIQSDGKIIIGGTFTSYNGTGLGSIARLNVNGSLDSLFNQGTGASDWVYTTAIQSDGKIVIGGWFEYYNGSSRNSIARLNTDGSLDTTFNPGTGTNHYVRSMVIQSDGKIIIGGNFSSFNGMAINRIARLNSDGSLDVTFNPGTGANDVVWTISQQSNGKIIIGGWFTNYNGTTINRLARLNEDGSLDTSFATGTGSNHTVSATAIQSDGKIIIGGEFTNYNGEAFNRIARLNANGSPDTSFNPGTGIEDYSQVYTTAIQSDGKIIIGGNFISYNGTARSRIVRLNSDGSLDVSFDPGTGAHGTVHTTAIQSDGRIIIGGGFTSYNGTGRNRIARILGSPLGIPTTQMEDGISIYPIPFSDEFVIEIEGNHKKLNFEILNSLGQVVLNGNVVDKTRVQTSQLAPGVYFVKLEKDNSFIVKKLIKE